MRLSSVRKSAAAPTPPAVERPPSVSPDDLVRLSEQRLELSLDARPITKRDLDLAAPLVPQIRHLLSQR